MRKAVFALMLSGFIVAPAFAQQAAWANKLFSNETSHDFGVVPRGAQLKHSFKITNIYKVPLEITNLRVSCGCVTATKSSNVIQPGDTGFVHINMDGTRFSGQKTVTIYVTVGPQFVSTASLVVSANARTDVVFNPGEIDFGLVNRGQSASRPIDVEYAGNFDWRITEIVKSAGSPFDLKVEELPRKVATFPTKGYRITATLKPTAAPGPFKQEVILKTNDPSSPVLTFNVSGNVRASITVAPNPINLAGMKVGEMLGKKIVVSGSTPFRITGVDGAGDGVTLEVNSENASTTHILDLRIQPRAAGDMNKTLVLRTDMANETATIVLEGTVAP
ncbi:MAG: DUF1573 domain-containing protein [Gemmataceae bacterium]|nr:DUF1573 domain-containing protein [Gemmataceae bacterium]